MSKFATQILVMKKIFVLVTILFCFILSQAQNPDAQNIIDKSVSKVKSSKGINVSFSLTQKDKQNQVMDHSKGTMKIKDQQYYIRQEGNEIFCNGTNIWNYDGENEVTLAKVDNDEDGFSPQQILTGFNKKDFDITLISSAGSSHQIQLTPVDKRKNFKQIMLYINKSTNLVSKAVITDKANTTTEISFNNISLNSTFADSQFVFDASKHPGVEVINQ